MTYKELVEKYSTLEEGTIIHIDNKYYSVITNHIDDVVFLALASDHSKSFHIFYEEMNPETDNFYII